MHRSATTSATTTSSMIPNVEPKSSKAWINLIEESEEAFDRQATSTATASDKQYASLERFLSRSRPATSSSRYSGPTPRSSSLRSTPNLRSRWWCRSSRTEGRSRPGRVGVSWNACATVAFDLSYIDELMKLVRGRTSSLLDRGVAWCRYESGKGDGAYAHEKVCLDFKPRRDFLHSVSRNWREVTWVAAASYLTRPQARKRFRKTSGDEYQNAEYRVDKDLQEVGGTDRRERACFWEIWDKTNRRVLWVAKGCEKILDEDDPHLDLRGVISRARSRPMVLFKGAVWCRCPMCCSTRINSTRSTS